MYPLEPFLVSTFLLLVIGLGCLIMKRDLIRLLIGVEILFNAANLLFVAFSTQNLSFIDPYPQSLVMMALVLDGTVIAVGLAIVLNVFKHYKTLDVKKLRRLKW
jgi:NADH:ubiquinone oxidoreductase subunit K